MTNMLEGKGVLRIPVSGIKPGVFQRVMAIPAMDATVYSVEAVSPDGTPRLLIVEFYLRGDGDIVRFVQQLMEAINR